MKKSFTLSLLLVLCTWASAWANRFAAPTTPATFNSFTTVDGDRLTLNFKLGNGASRIVVMSESPIADIPADGTDYTASTVYGTPGTTFESAQVFVVFKQTLTGNGNASVTVTKLNHSTRYYVRIFEYNGTGASTMYLTTPVLADTYTKSWPANQATNVQLTQVTGNAMTIKFTASAAPGADKYLVVARKGGAVTAVPEQLKDYSSNPAFKLGEVINGDNYVVYDGTYLTQIALTNFEPNATYHFAVFAFNGNLGPVYNTTVTAIGSATTNAGPTAITGNGAISSSSVEGNGFTISFAAGNGAHQLIIARKGTAVSFVPTDGAVYTASTQFGNPLSLVGTDEYVMNTDGSNRTFTGMEPNTTYHFRIYEYDVTETGFTYYLKSSFRTAQISTATTPAESANTLQFTNITGTGATIQFNAPSATTGAYRMILMRDGAAVDAAPADLTRYTASSTGVFNPSGNKIGTDNIIVFGQSNNRSSLPITGLTAGHLYHVAIFEFNGNNVPVYKTDVPARASVLIPNEPIGIGTTPAFGNIEGNSMRFQWSGGSGARKLVIARKDQAVTATPVDGTTYTAVGNFDEGTMVAPGEYVVYDGTTTGFTLQKLQPGSTYHFAVFEYNNTAAGPDYLATTWLAASHSTASAPTSQISAIGTNNIQNNQATLTFSKGNGDGYLFIMRAGSAPTVSPANLTKYDFSTTYKTKDIGGGNYAVQRSSSIAPFTVTGLAPGTTYFVEAYEFNGDLAPVYKTPAATFSFSTTGFPLPVKWLFFTARENNSGVRLEWGTAQEEKTAYFVVERSTGGGVFTSIDTVTAKGGSHINNYSYTDATKPAGRVLYRLKQVDVDNRFDYSAQVAVKQDVPATGLNIYPNPAPGYARIGLPNNLAQATVQLYDARGTLVKTMRISNNQVVYLQGLTPGIYSMVVSNGTAKYTERLIIQ